MFLISFLTIQTKAPYMGQMGSSRSLPLVKNSLLLLTFHQVRSIALRFIERV